MLSTAILDDNIKNGDRQANTGYPDIAEFHLLPRQTAL
jgi:hypothetical protein